jgi:sigma-B regulation protein RsbU (phosphoserine phosphatase)
MKLDIRRKVLLLVLSGSLVTFFSLAAFLLYGIYNARTVMHEQSEALSESAASYTENVAETQIRKRMEEVTRVRAQNLNRELENVAYDAKYLSDELTDRLKHPEKHMPRILPNALYTDVPPGKAFIHYSPALAKQGVSAGLLEEIRLVSGIEDSFSRMSEYYPSVFLGSKSGYTLIRETLPEDRKTASLSTAQYRQTYDPRDRVWYKLAKDAAEPVFTDIYIANNTGEPCVSCAVPYYDAAGFAGVVGIDCSVKDIYGQIVETAVSDTEASFVLNRQGEVIFSSRKEGMLAAAKDPQDLRKSAETSLARETANMVAGGSGVTLVTVDGKEHFLAYAPIKSVGWSFGTLVDKGETINPAVYARDNTRSQMQSFVRELGSILGSFAAKAIAIMAILLSVIVYFSTRSAKRFVQPVLELTEGMKRIAKGDLDTKLSVQTGDEIELLANGVNEMTADLKTYMADLASVTAEKERIATELSVAKSIQEGMLPKEIPGFSGRKTFDVLASMQAAKEVGGDFYDYYMVNEHYLAVTVADVSGKGIPAALFMVKAKTVLQNYAQLVKNPEDLGRLMARANDRLCRDNEENMFVTAFIGLLDIRNGEFFYVNAGHNPPLLRRNQENEFAYFPIAGTCMMGVREGLEIRTEHLSLLPGDCLFLYTDGVTEAMDENSRVLTKEGLKEALDAVHGQADAEEMLTAVAERIKSHVGATEQSDDITMLGLLYKG